MSDTRIVDGAEVDSCQACKYHRFDGKGGPLPVCLHPDAPHPYIIKYPYALRCFPAWCPAKDPHDIEITIKGGGALPEPPIWVPAFLLGADQFVASGCLDDGWASGALRGGVWIYVGEQPHHIASREEFGEFCRQHNAGVTVELRLTVDDDEG